MSKEEFANAVKNMSKDEIKKAIIHMTKADIKEAVKNMSKEQLKEALKNMSKEQLKEAFKNMSKEQLQEALKDMSNEQLQEALKTMSKEQLEEALKGLSKEQLREALKNMSEDEIRALKKAGKLDGIEGIDDIISPYDKSDDSDDDSSDEEGGKKKKKKKKRSDSAYSYYSVTSEGGTRYVRRRHKRADGTYSDSESCPSDVERKRAGSARSKKSKKSKKGKKDSVGEDGVTDKKGKKKGGKGGKDGDKEGGDGKDATKKGKKGKGGKDGDGESDSDFSIRSEVSAGGTRRQVKVKRIRDEEGNVIGYGDPVPYDYRAESVSGRRGSIESLTNREGTLDREQRRRAMEELEAQVAEEREKEEAEMKKRKYQEERARLNMERRKQRDSLRGSMQGKDLLGARKSLDAEGSNMDGVLLVQGQGADGDDDDVTGKGKGGEDGDGVPSEFSDDSLDDDNVDLSKMTEKEKKAYLAEREKKRQLQEARRRAKYGDKYDEVMKKKQAKKAAEEARKAEEQAREEELQRLEENQKLADERRRKSLQKTTAANLKIKEKPKSMVTYDKGPPRWPQDRERSDMSRDPGPGIHDRRNSRSLATGESQRRASRGGNDEFDTSRFGKLLPIRGRRGSMNSEDTEQRNRGRRMHPRGEIIDRNLAKVAAEKAKKGGIEEDPYPDDDIIEVDESGRLRLRRGKKVDLSKLSDEMLKKLGIDPNLSNKEKAKLLKKLFGSDIDILDKGNVIGTKGIDEYDLKEVTDDMLAEDPDLDIDTLTGQRRVNVLMRRGGMLLKEHMRKVMEQCRLMDDTAYRNDLDEKGDIDFMHHYRLVDPGRLEAYAKAFVVEDGDMDTVINLKEMITALDGVPTIQHMTDKQFDYVFKVLNIHDATQVTFRMFAVITALCERVTSMDNLSKHLLEICNLADIERKLDLYRSMFYHNIQSGLDPNHITNDSLKIELIAGGLSWLQQQYIMEKMDTNLAGHEVKTFLAILVYNYVQQDKTLDRTQISFLDYMCYIPLFLSMHDNIVDNPLDMSDQKYTLPPRTRPASAQRDLNPLGFPLSKNSSLQMRHKAKDLQEGRLKPKDVGGPEMTEKLNKFSKLPEIKPMKRTSTSTTRTSMSSIDKIDLIF